MKIPWRVKRFIELSRNRILLWQAQFNVHRFPRRRRKEASGLARPLIVSLTSYPPRFPTLSLTLRSLLDQSVQADRTILWISADDIDLLPADVLSLQQFGLEIRTCDDIGPYKKLVPALEAFPDAFIVTADDDIYYPPHWLQGLVERVNPAKQQTISYRAHIAYFDDNGAALPYSQWEFETHLPSAEALRTALFPTGGAGVLYPPDSLHPLTCNRSLFMELCPKADDVWFFWMQMLAGTTAVRVKQQLPLIAWPQSQTQALFHHNLLNNGNDPQIRAVQDRLGYFRWDVLSGRSAPANDLPLSRQHDGHRAMSAE